MQRTKDSSVSSESWEYDKFGCYTRDVILDCKNKAPTLPWTPVYHICWGFRSLPQTLNFIAGPTTFLSDPPDTITCFNWPTTQIAGSMSRGTPDGFSACYALWSSQPPFKIVFNYKPFSNLGDFTLADRWPISTTIDRPDLTVDFALGLDMPGSIIYSGTSGSCSQSPSPGGPVTLTISTLVTIANKCSCPITVWYQG